MMIFVRYPAYQNDMPFKEVDIMFLLSSTNILFTVEKHRILIPFQVLNNFLCSCFYDGGMGFDIEWKPFNFSYSNYLDLISNIENEIGEPLRKLDATTQMKTEKEWKNFIFSHKRQQA